MVRGQFIRFNGCDLESIVLQNNVTTIADSEDTVSAIDAFDKSNDIQFGTV